MSAPDRPLGHFACSAGSRRWGLRGDLGRDAGRQVSVNCQPVQHFLPGEQVIDAVLELDAQMGQAEQRLAARHLEAGMPASVTSRGW